MERTTNGLQHGVLTYDTSDSSVVENPESLPRGRPLAQTRSTDRQLRSISQPSKGRGSTIVHLRSKPTTKALSKAATNPIPQDPISCPPLSTTSNPKVLVAALGGTSIYGPVFNTYETCQRYFG